MYLILCHLCTFIIYCERLHGRLVIFVERYCCEDLIDTKKIKSMRLCHWVFLNNVGCPSGVGFVKIIKLRLLFTFVTIL